jgi:acyl-CoA hydrolase
MKLIDADTALAHLQSGQQVFVQGAAATPTVLLEALARRGKDVSGVGVVHLHTEGPAPHLHPSLHGHLHHRALFIGPNARDAVNEGRAEYIPVFLSDIPRLFRRRTIPIDVALLNVSPPDAHGFCSLGTSVDVTLAAVECAPLVIAQINPRMPRTHGDGFLHVSRIDWGVTVEQAPHVHPEPEITAVERKIGEFVAELIPDQSTLQLGIGAIPSAVALALRHKRDLGIHTEMFTDAVIDLVERGVVTGAKKEINRGKIVSSFVLGTQRLYDFVHDNPLIELRPSDYTNDAAVIRRLGRMVAINSAVEIDLTGQVCADSIGSRLFSGVGGQMDFIRGAATAEDGRAIIAFPSTAAGGSISRIAAILRPGSGVVTTRAHVHTVVTEWGVAELHGRGIAERARALIAIADPRFREELSKVARERHFLE